MTTILKENLDVLSKNNMVYFEDLKFDLDLILESNDIFRLVGLGVVYLLTQVLTVWAQVDFC